MKKTKMFSRLLAGLLCVLMVLAIVPLQALAAPLDNFDLNGDYEGLKLSVIGDSISTYYGVTNSSTYNPLYLSTSEATFGTYYGNTSHGDYSEFSHVKRADTWWQQTVDTLGMELLVNNAWSGSFVLKDSAQGNTTEYGAAAYKHRSVNLHYGSEMPDIIAVYLGTNDVANYSSTSVGSKANVDTASERSALYTSVNNYATPSTSVEAYYIMLSRMIASYPDAEIYCMLPTICLAAMSSGRQTALDNFNGGVKYLVDYFAGQGKKVYLVDLDNDSGLVNHTTVKNYYYCNNVHPGPEGMDMITTCLISEIMEHSAKGNGSATTHKVTYNLSDAFVSTGLTRYAEEGKSFQVDLLPYYSYQDIELTVTMTNAATGEQVEIPGYGVSGHSVYIPKVTGPITITAKADKTNNYYWTATDEALVSMYSDGFDYNDTTLTTGTYTGNLNSDGSYSGACDTVQYELGETVLLQHDKPWVLEFRSGGGTYAGGIMLFNGTQDSPTSGNTYIHITQSNVLFGYRDSVGYNNSGISWATIASKLGSTAGSDIRNEMMDFRIVNVPTSTSNKIYLYVNNVEIGTMDSVKMIGGSTTHASVGDIDITGKDFEFNYMGSLSHSLQNCSIDYIKVWENGKQTPTERFETYRWELTAGKNGFVSVDDSEVYTENALDMLSGSVSGGAFSSAVFTLDKTIVLKHDRVWRIEWVSEGDWIGDRNGSMLLATDLNYKAMSAPYLFRRIDSEVIAIGEWDNGVHNNYGIRLADYGIDGTVRHKYTLVNELTTDANGKVTANMVYLYVDNAKVGPLNTRYQGGASTGEPSDWFNGRDFAFSHLGTTEFTIGGCNLEYLEISTECPHSYGDWTTVDPTCTVEGVTSRTCSLCGNTEAEYFPALGHAYGEWTVQDATCTTDGKKTRTCGVCGHTENQTLSANGHAYDQIIHEATCNEYTIYEFICGGCGDHYSLNAWDLATNWLTELPEGMDASLFNSKTQYRYSDYETKTSYDSFLSGYTLKSSAWEQSGTGTINYVSSWPSGFYTSNSLYTKYNNESSKKTASETTTAKTVINSDAVVGYLYYHWCYSGSYYSVSSKSGSYTTFHAFYTTKKPSECTNYDASDGSYYNPNSSCCSNSNWFWPVAVYAQNYTTYNKLFTYERWTDYTDWRDTAVTASTTRKVETRTVYQLKSAELGTHKYNSVVTAPTCTSDGYTTYTCSACGSSYTDDKVSSTGHSWSDGVCGGCGINCNHSYSDGICSVCGIAEPVKNYYLFGYINGRDYGCENDYANMGDYKFVDGKIVVTFESDSYVGVKTENNTVWYLTDGWLGKDATSATLYNAATLASADKLYVPGGVEVTFTLQVHNDGSLTLSYVTEEAECEHNYVDGVCTNCGESDPDYVKPTVKPSITLKSPALLIEDEVIVVTYYNITDVTDVVEMGMLTWSAPTADVTINSAEHIIPGGAYDEANACYRAQSQGIPAKEMGDKIYLAIYAKLSDGSYVYTKQVGYSAKNYCASMLATSQEDLKPLLVALLNYGAAAQKIFNYNTDALVNADLTAAQKALVSAYDDSMVAGTSSVPAAKQGAFVKTATGFSAKRPSVSVLGAFAINYNFTPNVAVAGDMTLYVWDQATYVNNEVLTAENAIDVITMAAENGVYTGTVSGIAAKELDVPVYVAGVYTDTNGNTYSTGVLSYSVSAYCKTMVNDATTAEIAQAIAVYGYYAKNYFANLDK